MYHAIEISHTELLFLTLILESLIQELGNNYPHLLDLGSDFIIPSVVLRMRELQELPNIPDLAKYLLQLSLTLECNQN